MFHILAVEEETLLCRRICAALVKNGYSVYSAPGGEEALSLLEREYIDLMICSATVSDPDGYELVRMIREAGNSLPVLMISSRGTISDMRRGFMSGADDFMTKPVSMDELLLRVGALLRRARAISERRISCGSLILDYDALTVSGDGFSNLLPQKEFYLLYKLLSFSGKIFTRQQLMDEIWGMDSSSGERTVDVHINRLRERFCGCGDFEIITVRGLGYKAVRLG